MNVIALTPLDLSLAALLVIALAGLSAAMRLGLEKSILWAGARTTVQLLLIGLVLKKLFANAHWAWVGLLALIMLTVAGYEIVRRQRRPLTGPWGFGIGAGSMFVSAFSVTVLALVAVVGPEPWYAPQYAIPLLGMMLGNSMNGIALSVDRLTAGLAEKRAEVEAQLILGATASEAAAEVKREAVRVGLIPTINAMAAAGIVSLPGMMTGQILAGSPPAEAVKYQILIMFMIAGITGAGAIGAVTLTARRMFDARERLRLDRITGSKR